MKRTFIILLLLGYGLSTISFNDKRSDKGADYPELCSSKDLISKAKEGLKSDFIYDGFKLVKVKLKDVPQVKKLLYGVNPAVDIRYVFNREALPVGSEIRIYNSKKASDETLRFKSTDFDDAQDILVFNTTADMWAALIEIKLPAASEGITSGCLCTMAGYRVK
ncbi:MAG: hypothetical protein JKX73_03370 [Flavobacteriales bacterium]|nr:hypothetical protein [Flavobacteriales bacterium]